MGQSGGDLDLAPETVGADRAGDLRMEHLDRHLPAMAKIFGQVDRCHPTLAQLALDPVAVRQRRDEPIERRHHRAAAARQARRASSSQFTATTTSFGRHSVRATTNVFPSGARS